MWQQFRDDYQQMDGWLSEAEKQAKNPRTDTTSFTVLKQELHRFEVSKYMHPLNRMKYCTSHMRIVIFENFSWAWNTFQHNEIKGMNLPFCIHHAF